MPFLPDVILLGTFPLATIALTGLIGGTVAYLLAGWQAHQAGARPDRAQDLILNLFIGGVAGAKLVYVVLDPVGHFANPATLIMFPYGPLALPAAIVGSISLAAWGMRRVPNPPMLLDLVAAPLTIGLGVAAAGWIAPGSWSFAPLLTVVGGAALVLGRPAKSDDATRLRPGQQAALTLLLTTCTVVLADIARPAADFGGVSTLQWTAGLTGTAAYMWARRRLD